MMKSRGVSRNLIEHYEGKMVAGTLSKGEAGKLLTELRQRNFVPRFAWKA